MKPLILDFDASVLPLPEEQRLHLHDWQEELRFGCKTGALDRLEHAIGGALDKLGYHIGGASAAGHGTVFLGSGDFHHLSHLLIRRYASLGRPLQAVVFDNHPDNMRYPFGIHCGSWVWHLSRLPFVTRVHVLGIASTDVEAAHGWENHVRNLRSGKVRYWCVGRNLDWMQRLGIKHSHSFPSMPALLQTFGEYIATTAEPVYLSIDKDVLAPEDAHTNWDQGVMRLTELQAAIAMLAGRIVGSDVTGEVSIYRYQSRFKRLLSGIDGQTEIDQAQLEHWQREHQAINLQLIEWLKP